MLDQKAIVITGAASGLGRAFARRCAALGAHLLVNDIDDHTLSGLVEEVRAGGGLCRAVPGSVANWSVAEALTRICIDEYGRIDGLVNNAAAHHIERPWREDETNLRRLIDVNVLGPLQCGVHALRAMVKQKAGSIVNLTSGAHLGLNLHTTYGATKAAVVSMTYGWAGEASPYGIRVNAISPLASTPMAAAEIEVLQRFDATDQPSAQDAPPEAVAPLAAFLLSDRSEGITGQIIGFVRGRLGLYRPATANIPSVYRDDWREADIAEAFEGALRNAQHSYSVLPASPLSN